MILLVIVFATYANTLVNRFVWDDEVVITGAKAIRSWRNVSALFSHNYFTLFGELSYRPVVTFTYFVDYSLWKLKPAGYHLTNLLLHACTTISLFALIRELFGRRTLPALFATCIFAVHPANAEAVNAIGFREDLPCGAFFFLSIWAYVRRRHQGSWGWAVLSWTSFALALYSKEMAATLPIVLIVYEWLLAPQNAQRRLSRIALGIIPFVLIFASMIVLRLAGFRDQAASIPYWGGGIPPTLLNIPRAVIRYVWIVIMPMHLHVERNLHIARGDWHFESAWTLALVLTLIVCSAMWAWKRSRLAAFASAFFFLALLPVSNIIPLRYFLAERFLYIPLAGACIVAGLILRRAMQLDQSTAVHRLAWLSLIIVIVGSFALHTAQRNRAWRDQMSLWSETLKITPDNFRVRYSVGLEYWRRSAALRQEGDLAGANTQMQKALQQFNKVLAINPYMRLAHFRIGEHLLDTGDEDQARKHFEIGMAKESHLASAHAELGGIYIDRRMYAEAAIALEEAVRIAPKSDVYLHYLGQSYMGTNRFEDAQRTFQRFLDLYPHHHQAHLDMGMLHMNLKDNPQAMRFFQRALQLAPTAPDRQIVESLMNELRK